MNFIGFAFNMTTILIVSVVSQSLNFATFSKYSLTILTS